MKLKYVCQRERERERERERDTHTHRDREQSKINTIETFCALHCLSYDLFNIILL